jgi:CheY-like chemotaxis protein
MPRQPIDQNSAIGKNQKNPKINHTANNSISRQDKPTPISSERLSDNKLPYSSDGSSIPLSDNEQLAQSKVIMVVDDSQTVRNIMALILNRSGYRSIRISSAMEALHTLTELIPDLIFLDITLPGMDGLDVCKIIKENPRTKQVPVVMLSGNNEVFDKVMGRLAGASDYITKPFEPESILMCIQSFLGQKSSHKEGLWQGVR